MTVKIGTLFNDTLTGTSYADSISGLAGNDDISGGDGKDLLDGGNGEDTLRGDRFFDPYSSSYDELLQLNREGSDTLLGGFGNDFLVGGAGQDTLIGGAGDDFLWGGYNAGEGFLYSVEYDNNGYSNDLLVGGSGNDTLRGDSIWTDPITDLYSISGNDTLDGGSGDDLLQGASGEDYLYGGSGNDTLIAGYGSLDPGTSRQYDGGNDFLYGGNGDDHIFADSFGKAYMDGGNGNDVLQGNGDTRYSINDTLIGGAGDDSLSGGNGGDVLDGGAGNDVLIGDIPFNLYWYLDEYTIVDTLTGGAGADQFILGDAEYGNFYGVDLSFRGVELELEQPVNEYAIITDFNTNEDVIQLPKSYVIYPNPNDLPIIPIKYILGSVSENLPQGTGIYLDEDIDVLLAIVQGVSNLNLDQSYFSFA